MKKDMTYADLTSQVTAKQKKYEGIINDPNATDLMRKTAQKNLTNLNEYANEIFAAMEEDKQSMGIGKEKKAKYGYGQGLSSYIPTKRHDPSVPYRDIQSEMESSGYSINPFFNQNKQSDPLGPYSPYEFQQTETPSPVYESGNDALGYVIPGLNIARGIFEKPDTINAEKYKTYRKATSMRMDIDPQLRDLEADTAIARRNIRTMSPSQVMSGNIAISNAKAANSAKLYGNKFNVDQQSRLQADAINREQEMRNKALDLSIYDMNLQSKAAKENILQTGLSQALQSYYMGRNNKIVADSLTEQARQFDKSNKENIKMFDKEMSNREMLIKSNEAIEREKMKADIDFRTKLPNTDKKSDTKKDDYSSWSPTIFGPDGKPVTDYGLPVVSESQLTDTKPTTKPTIQPQAKKKTTVKPVNPDTFVARQAYHESGWNPLAYNPKSGAAGYSQFMADKAYDEKLNIHPSLKPMVETQSKIQSNLGALLKIPYNKRTTNDNIRIKGYREQLNNIQQAIKDKNNELFSGLESTDPSVRNRAIAEAAKDDRFNQAKSWQTMNNVMSRYRKQYGNDKLALIAYHSGPGRIERLMEKTGKTLKELGNDIGNHSEYLTDTEKIYLSRVNAKRMNQSLYTIYKTDPFKETLKDFRRSLREFIE